MQRALHAEHAICVTSDTLARVTQLANSPSVGTAFLLSSQRERHVSKLLCLPLSFGVQRKGRAADVPTAVLPPTELRVLLVTSPAREAMSESDKKIDFDLNLKVNTPFF
jgi:hypothetical protein